MDYRIQPLQLTEKRKNKQRARKRWLILSLAGPFIIYLVPFASSKESSFFAIVSILATIAWYPGLLGPLAFGLVSSFWGAVSAGAESALEYGPESKQATTMRILAREFARLVILPAVGGMLGFGSFFLLALPPDNIDERFLIVPATYIGGSLAFAAIMFLAGWLCGWLDVWVVDPAEIRVERWLGRFTGQG